MKKVIVVFALIFVAGIMAGGVYDWFSNQNTQKAGDDHTKAASEKTELSVSSSESIEKAETTEQKSTVSGQHRVTNPDKICSTPGCGRAVFVTYKGKELCVRCYGEAKNRDAGLN